MQKRNLFLALFVRAHAILCTLFITMALVNCGYTFYQATASLTKNDEASAVAFVIVGAIIAAMAFLAHKWCKMTNGAIEYATYMWPACPRFDLLIKGAKSGRVDDHQFFTTFSSFKHSRTTLPIVVAITTAMVILKNQPTSNFITFTLLGFEVFVIIALAIVGILCANWSEA